MKRVNKKNLLIVILLFISIGFAVLSSNLNINGLLNVQEANWNVYLDNIQVKDGSLDGDLPVISDNTSISFNETFTKPGEFYEFSVDIVNDGTMDAVISSINKSSLTTEQAKYLNYTVRYYGTNTAVASNYIIPAGYKQRIVIRVEYKFDVEQLITFNNIDLSLSIGIVQRDKTKTYSNPVYNFFMINGEAVFNAPKTGTYKLETWGAQGGSYKKQIGGYGGYSTGKVYLNKNDKIYINVGGTGKTVKATTRENYDNGGYNGGGSGSGYDSSSADYWSSGGGGATHISTSTGLLSTLSSKTDTILIVSGGGGGNGYTDQGLCVNSNNIAAGGGIAGNAGLVNSSFSSVHNNGLSGSQTTGGSFGKGESCNFNGVCSGGGSGYYGGYMGLNGAGGGSGYIGNSLLTEKVMYCYNCQESTDVNTKTISTTNVSPEPFSNYAKIGDGYARITYIG